MAKQSTQGSIFMSIFLTLFIFSNVIMLFAYFKGQDAFHSGLEFKLQSDINLTFQLLDTIDPSPFSIENKVLKKGKLSLNHEQQLLESIKKATNNEISFFQYQNRISTTLDESLLGAPVESKIATEVFYKRLPYKGYIVILDKTYYAIYTPIYDKNENVIGIMFQAVDVDDFSKERKTLFFNIATFQNIITILAYFIIINIIQT